MRGILFAFLISSLSFQWVLSSLPFTCDNTLDLEYDPLVDSQFTTTYDLNFFYEMSSILIQVTKDENYDQSNVKGIFLSAFGLDADGNLTSTPYGEFPIVTTDPPNVHTIGSPCNFVLFTSWPGNFSTFWKTDVVTGYPERIRLCVGIAVSESPLSGYTNCMDARKAQAVTEPTAAPGNGQWNNNIDMECTVTVFPAPVFHWYYNGVKIQENEHYAILDTSASYDGDDGHQSVLSVKAARTYDTIFEYFCSVTNILQTPEVHSNPVSLTISDLALVLLDSPDSVVNGFLTEGLVIQCSFASYPRPVIKWKKDNTLLTSSSEIAILPSNETEDESRGIIVTSRLAFTSLAHSDAGEYACEAMRGGTTSLTLPYAFTLGIISASAITSITPDSVALVSTYVTLNCQASGIPTPQITWYNSAGGEIGTTSAISVRVMNSGVNTWTCEASNAGGTATNSTSVTGYIAAASITTAPANTAVRYRETASFLCQATGDPTPVVKWYFTAAGAATERELIDSHREYSTSASSLVIQKATLTEEGTYRCEASNIARAVSASADLQLQIVRPTVQITPLSMEVAYGTAHTISCTAGGMPAPVQTIKKPNGDKVTSPYTITSLDENDVGLYLCIATSPANGEVALQSATYSLPDLTVSVAPSTASIDRSSTSVHSFTCTVLGTPSYQTIKWFHRNPCSEEEVEILGTETGFSLSNNEVLDFIPSQVVDFFSGDYICEVERYSVKYRGSASLTLTSLTDSVTISSPLATFDCPNLSAGLSRQFQCNAVSSESNTVTYSWFLNQNRLDPGSDDTQITLASDGYGNYRCVATAGQVCDFEESAVNGGLTVTISPATQDVAVEDSFSINCIAAGFPTVAYTWAKDGVIIPSQTNSILTIGAATPEDTGAYTCTVGVAACGGAMTSSNSNVNVMQSSPSISAVKEDIDVQLGISITLVCYGSGSPAPSYQWYKDSSPIASAESNTYTISSAAVSDNGLYTCEAFSYVSRSFEDIASVSTYQTPQDMEITVDPTGDVKRGTAVTLSCYAFGIPSPDYSWYDSDNILYGNSWILQVVIENEIEFTCVADNIWGSTRDSVLVTIVPDPTNLLIILPIVLGVTALVIFSVMICLVCLMWIYNYRKKVGDYKGEIAEDSNVLLEDQVHTAGHVVQSIPAQSVASESSLDSIKDNLDKEPVGLMGGLDRTNPLTAGKLQALIATVEKTGGFDGNNELSREFESTPTNMAKWTTIPKDSEVKNRYMNVMPNPDTMVPLSDTGEPGSTFINANFITNFCSKRTAYISTQGPLPSTIVDFWRMVWENDVSAVIMTCLLFERKRIRSARYWPDTQQRPTEVYGHFKLSIDSFAKADNYEVSLLYLFNLKAGPDEVQKKQVYHYWYKDWPSYGVPKDTNNVWKFLEEVNNTVGNTNKPLLFHCSAGIGRTAVFIGADMGMKEFNSSSRIDPLKYLCLLRKGRGGSIQTAEQYLYMHRVLSDFITAKQTKI